LSKKKKKINKKNKIKKFDMWHMTCDTWHVTHNT
jgi:hypothetical protein